MNRITGNCATKWSQVQKIVGSLCHTKIYPRRRQSSKLFPNLDFSSKYNEETIKRVLHVLNNADEDELSRYNISKGRASNVAKYRRTVGPFTSMEQVLAVDNFGVKVLKNLVSSIAQGSMKKEALTFAVSKLLSNIIAPNLEDEKRSAIKTVTGIIVRTEYISWAKIDSNDNLLTWDSHRKLVWPKKDNPMEVHDMALKIRRMLPQSDVYVTDLDPRSKYPVPVANSTLYSKQKIQFTSMLATLIATRFDSSNGDDTGCWTANNNFYYLNRDTPPFLFGLFIGNETAAARNVVEQMMDHTRHTSLKYVPSIIIDSLKYELYNKYSEFNRETLSQALILSITFMQLLIKRNPQSLEAAQRRPNQRYK